MENLGTSGPLPLEVSDSPCLAESVGSYRLFVCLFFRMMDPLVIGPLASFLLSHIGLDVLGRSEPKKNSTGVSVRL